MAKCHPPSHLADLSIVQVIETNGRERRYRYFTLSHYTALMEREGLGQPESPYPPGVLSTAGGFSLAHMHNFFREPQELSAFLSKYKAASGNLRLDGNIKRKRKRDVEGMSGPEVKRKRGRPKKVPDSSPAKEREAKEVRMDVDPKVGNLPQDEAAKKIDNQHGRKRKRDFLQESETEGEIVDDTVDGASSSPKTVVQNPPLQKPKRGRPPKKKHHPAPFEVLDAPDAPARAPVQSTPSTRVEVPEQETPVVPKRRGRPPKSVIPLSLAVAQGPVAESGALPEPKRRGRPPKPKKQPKDKFVVLTTENWANNQTPQRETASSRDAILQEGMIVEGINSDERTIPVLALPLNNSESAVAVHLAPMDDAGGSALCLMASKEPIVIEELRLVPSPTPPVLPRDFGDVTQVYVGPSSNGQVVPNALGTALRSAPLLDPHDVVPADEVPTPVAMSREEFGGTIGSHLLPASSALEYGRIAASPEIQPRPMLLNQNSHQDTPFELPIIESVLESAGPSKGRQNLSQLRRENELYRIIERAGGIITTSGSELIELHTALIEASVKAGEVTSGPIGSRIDRKTLNLTLDKMESRGRIKHTKTTMPLPTGSVRSVKVAYLPEVTENQLREYISQLGSAENATVTSPLQRPSKALATEVLGSEPSPQSIALQWLFLDDPQARIVDRWHRNQKRASQLNSFPHQVVREAFLMETQTLSQEYGYIAGKMKRVQALHVHTLKQFECHLLSDCVVSSSHRLIDWNYYHTDIPLSIYCSIVSSVAYREDLKLLLQTEEGRNMAMKDVPDDMKSALRMKWRDPVFDLLQVLWSLRIVTPVQQSHSETPWIKCAPRENRPASFDPMPEGWISAVPSVTPQYWIFNEVAPVYVLDGSDASPRFYKDVSIRTQQECMTFWELLKMASLVLKADDVATSGAASSVDPYDFNQRLVNSLKRKSSWNADYHLSWYQTQFMKSFVAPGVMSTPLDDADGGTARLHRISHAVCVPVQFIRLFYQEVRSVQLGELDRARKRMAARRDAQAKVENEALLARKAVEAAMHREQDWEVLVHRANAASLDGAAGARLKRMRHAFLQGSSAKTIKEWEAEVVEAVNARNVDFQKLFPVVSRTIVAKSSSSGSSSRTPVFFGDEKSVADILQLQQDSIGNSDISKEPLSKKPKRRGKGKGREAGAYFCPFH